LKNNIVNSLYKVIISWSGGWVILLCLWLCDLYALLRSFRVVIHNDCISKFIGLIDYDWGIKGEAYYQDLHRDIIS